MFILLRSGWRISLLLFGHLEATMHACDDEVEACENLIRIVERPVRQDVGFDSFQHPKRAAVTRIKPVRFTLLLGNLSTDKPPA